MTKIKVYVASKTRHAPMWREHRDAWRSLDVEIISTWIDEAGDGETSNLADLWTRCIDEAGNADMLIAYHQVGETWKGAYIEIGAALRAGKRVYVIGFPQGTFTHHPLVSEALDPDEAVDDFMSLV